MSDPFEDLTLHFAPASAAFEPNDSFSSASVITQGTQTITGTGIDWYRFDTLSGVMSFTMTPTDGVDLNMELRNTTGQAIWAAFAPGAESFTFLAPQDGTYYLKIFRAQFPGAPGAEPPTGIGLNYQLAIDLPEATVRGPADPGETRDTATLIDQGTRSITGTGIDWFRVETGPGLMSFTMAPQGGLPQNLNMTLFDSSGAPVRSNPTATGPESFTFLAPIGGTYYLNIINAAYPLGTPNGISMTYDLSVELPDKTFSLALPFGPVRAASLAVFDIDNDGRDEIFIGTSKALDSAGNEVRPAGLIVMEDDGTVKWTYSFPAMSVPDPKTGRTYNTTSVSTAPVFSDVNGDGRIDIVVGVGADIRAEFDSVGQPGDRSGVYALNADGSLLWFHQTRDSFGDDGRPDGVFGAPVVFDIDGDGVREVLFASWDHYLYVLDGRNGRVERLADLHDTAGASPTLVDLNNDGLFEIIMPSDITANAAAGLPQQGGVLHLFNNQLFQTVPGWNSQIGASTNPDYRGQFDAQSIWSTAQVVDLDRNGTQEIIVGTGNFFQDSRGQYIKVWNADGTLRHELATNGRTFAAPLIADLDGDGSPEIIAGTINGHVHAWRADGSALFDVFLQPFGTPAGGNVPVVRSPTAVDMNGDGRLEILVTAGNQTTVLSSTGTVLTSRTEAQLVHRGYEGSTIARDIDNDGRLDIITGGRDPVTNQAVIYRFENIFDVTSDTYRTAKYQEHQSLHDIASFVERFYSTILGRTADAVGLNGWTDLLYTGIRSGADVARGFVFSAEFIGRNTSDLDFVNTLYAAFFNRPADAGGQAGWLSQLELGQSREAVLNGFIGSQEFIRLAASFGIRAQNISPPVLNAALITGDTDSDILRGGAGNSLLVDQGSSAEEARLDEMQIQGQVYRLYQATLGRAPDTGGFIGWFDALQDGRVQLEQTAGAFVGSAEFSNIYGRLSNTAFVELLYQNVLGRAADPGGLAAWTNLLETGARSRAQVVLGFSESGEFQNNSNPGLDTFMRSADMRWNDAIESGAGNDTMNGGIGGDTFIFRRGQGGTDVIHGFEAWDNLQLSGFGFRTGGEARAQMRQDGLDVIFDHQNQTIRFLNTRLTDMERVGYNIS